MLFFEIKITILSTEAEPVKNDHKLQNLRRVFYSIDNFSLKGTEFSLKAYCASRREMWNVQLNFCSANTSFKMLYALPT